MPTGLLVATRQQYASGILVMSLEEYEAALQESEWTFCAAHQNRRIRRAEAFHDADDMKDYCSQACRDRNEAPMVKPQPKGTKVDGWDV